MSRGLGRVERLVLAYLVTWYPDEDLGLFTLTEVVAGLRDCPRCDPHFDGPRATRAHYVSTARAVASLESKGFVDTRKWNGVKRVRLSVDPPASLRTVQHLRCAWDGAA